MELLLTLASAALALFNGTCWRNLQRLPRLEPGRWDTSCEAPFISVLVPARNEAERIAPCLHSLCRQEYPSYEVVVLDDESTDATLDILEHLRTQYPERLRVLRGAPLPEGWIGKAWACWQLAQAARGEWFLFADADTVFHPLALPSLIRECLQHRWRFVSVLPAEVMHSFAERLIIPQLYIIYFAYIPDSWRRFLPSFHAASGQALLMEARLYWEIGGHEAVRAKLAEDIALGQRVARAIGEAPIADGNGLVHCRMYESSAEAIAGFSKNMYPAMGYRPWILWGFLLHLLVFFVLPPVAAVVGVLYGNALWSLLGLLSYGMSVLLRWQVSQTFKLPKAQIWFQPLAALLLCAIALNSYRWSITGRLQWKGRLYRPHTP